jgi:hypothetical protein
VSDPVMERLRAALERGRARAHRRPVPETPAKPLPLPTTNATPPRPWSETDREVGEDG